MTEQEWLVSGDAEEILKCLRGKASDRKYRLFAVACCRRIWSCLRDDRSRKAIEVSEQYADGQASDQDFLEAAEGARTAAEIMENTFRKEGGDTMIVNAAVAVSQGIAISRARSQVNAATWWDVISADDTLFAALAGAKFAALAAAGDNRTFSRLKHKAECSTQSIVARCIFSNFFYSVTLAPAWLSWNDTIIPKLAEAIYAERAFDRLPILADALEEAGCTDADILNHCRQPVEHVRGCWVVDLILGKS